MGIRQYIFARKYVSVSDCGNRLFKGIKIIPTKISLYLPS